MKKNQKEDKKPKNFILTVITNLTPKNVKLFWKSF